MTSPAKDQLNPLHSEENLTTNQPIEKNANLPKLKDLSTEIDDNTSPITEDSLDNTLTKEEVSMSYNENEQFDPIPEDDNFGNSKDYVPIGGEGLNGFYREPMSGKKWGYHKGRAQRQQRRYRQREQQYQQYQQVSETPEGILSIRQPGWQERAEYSKQEIEQNQSGILTIRQQGNLSHVLRWQHKEDSLRSGYPYPTSSHKNRRRHKRSHDNRRHQQRRHQQSKKTHN